MSKITNLPLAPSLDGTETIPLVKNDQTVRATIGALVEASVGPSVATAAASAASAQGFALALETTTAGGWFASLAVGAAATTNGQGFFVCTADGHFLIGQNQNGVGVQMAEFTTAAFMAGYIDGLAINPRTMGAKADGWKFTDGVISANALNQITFSNTLWLPSAVTVGNPICVAGAGAGGVPLVTTIAAVNGATITLATAAAQAVNGANGDFGTDDTAVVQAAINLAQLTGRPVEFGGAQHVYYIAGASYQSESANWPQGFNRGSLKISSAVSLRGNLATLLLSGGRLNPGGLFWNDFFTTPSQQLHDVRFERITLDCNIAAQYWAVLPAGFTSGQVWQWGHPICLLGARNVSVRHCVIKNARGNGVAVGSYVDPSGNVWQAQRVEVLDCEFDNCFMTAAQIAANDIEIADNWVHGDGYWVSAFDLETDGNTDAIIGARVLRNTIDFRDGLAPVERNTANATNSPAALAARIHLRRVVSSGGWTTGFAGNAWNGKLLGLRVAENTVYQGVIDVAAFCDFEIERNSITNTAETIPAGSILIGYNAIQMLPGADGNATTGLVGAKVQGNYITHPLPGYGIYVVDYAGAQIEGNIVNGAGLSGIRTDDTSGHVTRNQLTNCCGTPGQPSDYAAIAIFGVSSTPFDVLDNHVIDNRATPLVRLAVYGQVAVYPMTRLSGNVCAGFTPIAPNADGSWAGSPPPSADGTWSIANNAYARDNVITNAGGVTSTPLVNMALGGQLTVAGPAVFGDTTGNHDARMTLNFGTGGSAQINMLDPSGLEYVQGFSSAGFLLQRFKNGAFVATDLAIANGQWLVAWSWKTPLQIQIASATTEGDYVSAYLWLDQTGACRKKAGSAPTSDTDGAVGWS